MIGYPTRVVDLDGGHTALRTGLLAAGSLAVAVLVGMTPGAIMRRRRAAVAGRRDRWRRPPARPTEEARHGPVLAPVAAIGLIDAIR